MRLLIDTHLLLWTALARDRLSDAARDAISDPKCELCFSVASIWEIAIKRGKDRPDFQVEPALFRRNLLAAGYTELHITGAHAEAVLLLPNLHGDPFDRIMLAQAVVEGALLLTSDARLASYPGPVSKV